jgi:hypothetical protein
MAFGRRITNTALIAELRQQHPDVEDVFFYDSDYSVGHWVSANVLDRDRNVIGRYTRHSAFGKRLFEEADATLADFTDKAFLLLD